VIVCPRTPFPPIMGYCMARKAHLKDQIGRKIESRVIGRGPGK